MHEIYLHFLIILISLVGIARKTFMTNDLDAAKYIKRVSAIT